MISHAIGNFFIILLDMLIITSSAWLPLFLGYIFWMMWLYYVETANIASLDWKTIHIRVPRELARTPAGMEIVFAAMNQAGGTGEWNKRWWLGKTRAFYSLEIVSIEGNIYYFIRTEKRFLDLIRSYMYSQYPQCEVTEVEDYTKYIQGNREGSPWKMWACEFKLSKADSLPIKTYIDWGLDKTSGIEENQRIDPMAPVLEYMSTLGSGEQLWLQIIIMPATKRYPKPAPIKPEDLAKWSPNHMQDWQDQGKIDFAEFVKKNLVVKDPIKGEDSFNLGQATEVQKDAYNSFARNLSKTGFDTGMRCIYWGKGDAFNAGRLAFVPGMFRHFASPLLNGFSPYKTTATDYAWQDIAGRLVKDKKESMYKKYISRQFFYGTPQSKGSPFILTTEELATIFHLPGITIEATGIKRIEAKKAEPPINLPF